MKNLVEMENELYRSLENISTLELNSGLIFNPFFDRIVDLSFKQIDANSSISCYLQGTADSVIDHKILLEKLVSVSKRVLIEDMNLQREEEKLRGCSEEEEYQDYVVNYLMNPEYLKQLFQKYPVWKESLFQVVEFFVRNVTEIIQHLYSDQKNLNAEFFSTNNFDKIRRIDGSGSDTHCENRIVYRVVLDNDEILYHKSRVNLGVQFFYELYEKMCKAVNFLPYSIPTMIGDGYIWEKEAVYEECTNEKQVQNYFIRLGLILSICHFCHSGDMHYENMLAFGEYPLIIDFETLVQMMPNKRPSEDKKGSTILGKSVLPIGILPFYGSPGKAFNADFSGLCGGGKQVMDIKIPTIANPGKSTMFIKYRYGETREKNNRLRLNSELVQADKYINELIYGFEAGYLYILHNKKVIESMLHWMDGAIFRQLFRNTQEYHMILDLSYHPEFMGSREKRQAYFENILDTPLFEDKTFVVQQEIEDLMIGDVPYFQFNMSTGEILNCNGKVLGKYFQKTGMELLKEHLNSRSLDDLKLQKQLIEISLKYTHINQIKDAYETASDVKINLQSSVNLCSLIADQIYEHALDVDGQTLWMNTRFMSTGVDERRTYFTEICDRYLYEGTMGIVVFMAAFLKICPEHKIRHLYSKVVQDLFDYTDSEIKDSNKMTGVFLGESSFVYGYQILYKLTEEKRFLEYAKKHCAHVERLLLTDNQYDLIGGNAGAILALLNMYDLEKNTWYLDMARIAGNHLIQHAVQKENGFGWKNASNEESLGGFAHGCAGIMYALARLAKYTHENKYLEMAYKAFFYEKTMYKPEFGGWRDYRAPIPYYISDFKWCHGVAGIMLGWNLALEYFDEKRKTIIKNKIKEILDDFTNMNLKEEMCLCHGNMGNIIIADLSGVNLWKNSMEHMKVQCTQVLEKILCKNEGDIILYEQYDFSMMTGLAGIGYALLYGQFSDIPGLIDVRIK